MGFYRVLSKDELMHHGILGMKWGKRNGPPYPLGVSDHSSSEKKAGWRKSLNGGSKEKNAFSAKATAHKVAAKVYEINEKTYAKSNKALSSINRSLKNEQLKKSKIAQDEANARKFDNARKDSKLSDSQKKAIKIGLAVAGTALAAYGVYKLGQSDKLGNVGLKGAQIVDRVLKKNKGAGDFLNDIDDLSIASSLKKNLSKISISESCAKVNKGYSTGEAKYRNNCFSAVTADLLNRANNGQGLDVVARAATDSELKRGGLSFSEMLKPYANSSVDDIIVKKDNIGNAKQSISDSIISKCGGDDGYGIIRVRSATNSSIGHYIKWEISDGKLEFSDSLSGTMTRADAYFNGISAGRISRAIEFSRVDGLAVNPFEIAKLVEDS